MAAFLIFLFLFSSIEAKDLGSFGSCYEIVEQDFSKFLQQKIQTKNKECLNEKVFQKYLNTLKNSKGFEKAEKYSVRYKDPSISAKQEIQDDKGNIIVKKGEHFNPLDKVPLIETLLFFDGTDQQQCNWAKEFKEPNKWILVKGNPFDLQKKEQRAVYYDQSGVLSSYFEIKKVPTAVSQEKKHLKIEEIEL